MKKIKTQTFNFPVIIEKDEDGFFVADCPDLAGCHTQVKARDQSGSHAIYTHIDGRKTTIPNHPSETIGIGLVTKIIKKDLQITKEEFVKLLNK